ncbi:dihydroorotase [Schleiferiaceae bacterium]|nr:dihydroorotase [Flavobacteriales bacterium]MDC1021919.1 dihydroorotase [Schleiferiaceae bacterium]|tara:strand:+ start:5183 stop:6436 length:1254 start_codon:yes stop_codon:yes gene_type:complete
MKLLFKNALIVDINSPYNGEQLDVLIHDDRIEAIGKLQNVQVDQTVNLNGDVLTTGFAELHSDLGEPGNEESENLISGSAAAAAGGFTAVGVVSNGRPHIDNKTGVEFILNKSESLPIHLVPISTLSKDKSGNELSDMYEMNQLGVGIFGDYKRGVDNANLLKLGLLYAKPFGKIMVHPENHSLSSGGMMHEGAISTYIGLKGAPVIAETTQIQRDLAILEYTEGSLHIASLSTVEGVNAVREAKAKGLNVSASVNVSHLVFTDADLTNYGTEFKMNPPLRTPEDRAALRDAVLDGTIDCIAVDHLPKDIEQKQCEFDNAEFGMAGFEGALSALFANFQMEGELIQARLSLAPRKLLGLPEISIVEGQTAEFTILTQNTNPLIAMASKSFNNPFKLMEVNNCIRGVFVKGSYLSLVS